MELDEFFKMMVQKPQDGKGPQKAGPKPREIVDLLKMMYQSKASDMYLKATRPPVLRVNGQLQVMPVAPLQPDEVKNLLFSIMNQRQIAKLEENLEIDFSYGWEDRARFRLNVFFQRGWMGAVIRMISHEVPTIESLKIPIEVKKLAELTQGLVLVTGPAGSGKSSTLAAMIHHINQTRSCHIITIEDPIEFVHQDIQSVIEQREIELDTKSFANAIRYALRQDPDVILIGEMRDLESITIAIRAAETGHLVLSTLHTNDAAQTIDRIVDAFPTAHQQAQVRMQLSLLLKGVISQRLVRKADGMGLIPAVELMINSPHISKLIQDGKTQEITKAIEESLATFNMQSLDQALLKLYRDKVITFEEAMFTSAKPDDFRLKVSGIAKGR